MHTYAQKVELIIELSVHELKQPQIGVDIHIACAGQCVKKEGERESIVKAKGLSDGFLTPSHIIYVISKTASRRQRIGWRKHLGHA